MPTLSERLESEANKKVERGLYQQAELLREAAALAKRYEDAPVAEASAYEGRFRDFLRIDFDDTTVEEAEFVGQRVRIVLDKEG